MGDYSLSESQLMQGIDYCFEKASSLLDTVESLLSVVTKDKFWETSNALGVYTFAIEEFGKGLLLKDCYKPGSDMIQIPSWIFGRGVPKEMKEKRMTPHDEKIKRAFKELPDASKQMMVGIVVDKPGPDTKTLKFRDGGGISASGNLTGLFMTYNQVDFEVRMKCFYVYWNKDDWDYELITTKEYLQDAV